MRVVLAEHITDDRRRFLVRAAGYQAQLVHGVKNPAVHRLEAVAHVGERARHDDAHRVVDERLLHLLFDEARQNPFARIGAVMSIRTEGKAGPRYCRGPANILGMKTRRQPGGGRLRGEMPTSYGGTAGSSAGPPSGPPSMKNALMRSRTRRTVPGSGHNLGVQRHDDPADRFAMGIEDFVRLPAVRSLSA